MTSLARRAALAAALLSIPSAALAQDADAPGAPLAWHEGPALDQARDHHATFLVRARAGDFLYVAGGTDYRELFDGVVRARIGDDGALGPWEAAGRYPRRLGGTSVAVTGRWAVLTGGQISAEGVRGLTRVASVYVAPIGDDGRLGPWRETTPLPAPRFHHPALHHDGRVYVVGGQGAREAEAGVFAARVTDAGTIDAWTELRSLPRPRSHHAALIHDGHLYVVSGADGAPGLPSANFVDVIRAPVEADGSLGEWRTVSTIPHALATHAAFAHGGYLWLIGGVEDAQRFVDHVWRAPVGADGRVGAWEAVHPGLPVARGHVHDTPVVNGRFYSVGGRVMPRPGQPPQQVTGAVHVGTFQD